MRIDSDGWKLTAFASAAPLDLLVDPAERHAIALRYLADRAETRQAPDDLFIGFAGRAFFEAVSAQDAVAAKEIWIRLDRALHARYDIDVDTAARPPEGLERAPFDAIEAIMPFNLAVIMLARAYQRLNAGESRAALGPRFRAIRSVCGPLWSRLQQRNIGDMQTRQILWVAAAEDVLCAAAAGHASVLPMITDLSESPTGSGRADIIDRAVDLLLHGEHPFRAARLARAAHLSHMRRPGDISLIAMIEAFAREHAYTARRHLRAR